MLLLASKDNLGYDLNYPTGESSVPVFRLGPGFGPRLAPWLSALLVCLHTKAWRAAMQDYRLAGHQVVNAYAGEHLNTSLSVLSRQLVMINITS